jgi:preprotein translocase subunit SecF
MFVIRHKIFFFALSGILVLASILAISVWGLKPSVDFTGGSNVLVTFSGARPDVQELTEALAKAGFEGASVRESGATDMLIRTKPLVEGDQTKVLAVVSESLGVQAASSTAAISRLSSVGPTVGEQLRTKTMWAIILVVLSIILYVAFTFRKVSKPVSSWWYGLVAIIALLHDVTIPSGVFAVLGHYSGLEADTLFVVALLTILGLSVNDTIVVFDRIREHLRTNQQHNIKESFDETIGKSMEETYVRSFNTSLTVIIVLLALYFFGGTVIHSFVLTLLVGMVVGTYSSIFIASPLISIIGNRKVAKQEAARRR